MCCTCYHMCNTCDRLASLRSDVSRCRCDLIDHRTVRGHAAVAADCLYRHTGVVDVAEAELGETELPELVCGEWNLNRRRDFRVGKNDRDFDGRRFAAHLREAD